jgi:hypothetical protein
MDLSDIYRERLNSHETCTSDGVLDFFCCIRLVTRMAHTKVDYDPAHGSSVKVRRGTLVVYKTNSSSFFKRRQICKTGRK